MSYNNQNLMSANVNNELDEAKETLESYNI